MKNLNFKDAIVSAIILFILLLPIFGFQLTKNSSTVEVTHNWMPIFLFVCIIFLAQLFKHFLTKWLCSIKRINQHLFDFSSFLTKKRSRNLLRLIIISIIIWPFFASRSAIDIAIIALIYITLGIALNIVVGLAGLLNLGFAGFYAIGAYTYALLSYWFSWTFWEALPISGLVSAFFGILLGFPILRLRGDYLAVITLGFGEIIRLFLVNLNSYTLGPDGIPNLPKPSFFKSTDDLNFILQGLSSWIQNGQNMIIYLYLIVLFLALITLFVSNRLVKMPVGRAWEALREDEIACQSLGLNPARIKLSAFISAAFFAGLGGAFFAARQGSVSPESFTFLESAMILAIVVLGGMGSQIGIILAAIFLTIIPEIAREFAEYRMLLFGLLMVLTMLFCPHGFFPMKRRHVNLSKKL